jgi:amino acid permease
VNPLLCEVIVVVIIIPLNLIENLSSLRFSSAFGLCFSAYLVILILEQSLAKMTGPGGSFHQPLLWDFTCLTGLAVATSIFNFAYVLHLNVVPLYLELENKSPAKMVRVLRVVIAVTTTIYFIVGYAGLMLYGEDVKPNILLNFRDVPIYILARGAVCVAVTFARPLPHSHPDPDGR